MLNLLKRAFKEASRIPEHEQHALANLVFAAIRSKKLDRDPEKYRCLLREFQECMRTARIERDSLELDLKAPGHR